MENQTLTTAEKKETQLMQYISRSLLDLGMKPNLKGFNYLKEAVYLHSDIIYTNKRFTHIYAVIAEKYGVSASSVERAVRISIESAWLGDNLNLSHDLFGFSYITDEQAPTNSEFIATMSEIVKFGKFHI